MEALPLTTNLFASPYWPLILLLALWSLVWKGLTLWRAARLNSRNWFIALLVINTFGILEIVYYFFIAPKKEEKEEKDQEP